jgi:membrane protease YdiL (CAAX protease family)
MITQNRRAPTFWTTVLLLLAAARRRFRGRQTRQQQLLNNRTGKQATDWGFLGIAFSVLFMAIIHGLAATSVITAVNAGERLDSPARGGGLVVSNLFLMEASTAEPGDTPITKSRKEAFYRTICAQEATRIAHDTGGDRSEIQAQLMDSLERYGTSRLNVGSRFSPRFAGPESTGPIASLVGSIVLFGWAIMLIFQGEGLELDLQRRRSPMWEWIFSHPVPPGAVFFAEMLSPIAANPIYWSAPIFAGILYGKVYGPAPGLLAVLIVGIPITIALACVGKACEIAVVLRLSTRTRGAIVGLMSWTGYATMMLFLVGFSILPKVIPALARFLAFFAILPWPWLRLFLGETPFVGSQPGSFSFPLGAFTCWIGSALIVAGAVWFSVWGTQQGLSGNFSAADARPSRSPAGAAAFGKDPLYRKEFLWFIRDRSAIVQTILIPLTVAGVQAFNLRGILNHAQSQWNYLCGAAIFFGTYFLWVLGPKSLSSEGSALWIALTWPRGLESLLKAKAWLWSLISTGIVAIVLIYAAFLFPADIGKILILGIGWFFFGRSMAEKSVTLVTVTSDSGEQQKIPKGRRWAAQLGMLTFAIGVLTQQWHIAVMGIVYSTITAAAMWENFRARLPYLYDPWSEKVPPPPTLMHAMIAISILVEGGAVITGILAAAMGRENIAIAQTISYSICAVLVSIGVSSFLRNRDVPPYDVWVWQKSSDPYDDPRPCYRRYGFDTSLPPWLLAGAGAGVLLGLVAHGYLALLAHLPTTREAIHASQQHLAANPNLRLSYAVTAVLFAPFAEEYLFRGLLYRALDREWGGWHAVVGSAAFFAIYHQPLSWVPVLLVGSANAILFKKTGCLAPCVILHMVYNAVVLT